MIDSTLIARSTRVIASASFGRPVDERQQADDPASTMPIPPASAARP
jgi:hypothetical protein